MKRIYIFAFTLVGWLNTFAQSVYMHEAQEDAEESGATGFTGIISTVIFFGIIWFISKIYDEHKENNKRREEQERIQRMKKKEPQKVSNSISPKNLNDVSPSKSEVKPIKKDITQSAAIDKSPIESSEYILSYDKKVFIKNKGNGVIVVPEGVEIIKANAFGSSDIDEVVLPSSLIEIEKEAFVFSKIKRIKIPANVKKIGESAFLYCSKLEDVHIEDKIDNLSVAIFSHCENLKNITLPSTLQYIPKEAFDGCLQLTDIEIPKHVRGIADDAFCGCQSLKNIQIPESVKEIGRYAFRECYALKEIEIPEGVVGISEMCFYDCIDLVKIILPNSLRCIMRDAFCNCTGLHLQIPENVDYIEDSAFCQCNDMEMLVPAGEAENIKSKCENCYNLTIKEYSRKNEHPINEASNKDKETYLKIQKAKKEQDDWEFSLELRSQGIYTKQMAEYEDDIYFSMMDRDDDF